MLPCFFTPHFNSFKYYSSKHTNNNIDNIATVTVAAANNPESTKEKFVVGAYETVEDFEPLNLFGLKFIFYQGRFSLAECVYTLEELVQISNKIFNSFNTINQRGYVTRKGCIHPMFREIKVYLKYIRQKTSLEEFGNNPNTYSL
jgi:hypothetical protein